MNLVWISDSPDTPSGFGNVTRFVCEGLARRGHRVNILGWQTREAHDWAGCRVHPNGQDTMGSDALFRLLLRLRPEMVIALGDVWWLPYFSAPHLRRQMEMIDAPWALYFPIDGDMEGELLPPSWKELLGAVDIPIAMSQYGRRIVQQAGLSCCYIPHGVERRVFCPPADRKAAKDRVSAAGKFLVLSDSRNQPRKLLPRLLEIYARFAEGRQDVLLHLHTDPEDEFSRSSVYSYDVRADVRYLGLESKVRFTPGMSMQRGGGLPLSELAAYYQAADVHLLASSGEGFGLPTLQAAASGAVPMAGAYSASKELVEGHGQAIKIAEWAENEFGIRRGLIDPDDAVRKLTQYYEDRHLLAEDSARACKFSESYNWENVVDQWDQLLRSVSSRRGGRIVRVPAVASSEKVKQLLPDLGRMPSGISVKVKLVEHDYGRLESMIIADTRGRSTDVAIPTLPRAGVTAGVKVLRRAGYIGMSPEDTIVFQKLREIFPVLTAWTPVSSTVPKEEHDAVMRLPIVHQEEARLELAQSVMLLNVGGTLPNELLRDAAVWGIVCVGRSANILQQTLWPEATVGDEKEAVSMARTVLTNAAFARRAGTNAQETVRRLYEVDEKEMAESLRRLAAASRTMPVSMAG